MEYNKTTITAEQMDWEPRLIAACMELPVTECIPSSQDTGLYGVRWSHTEGIIETVLADIVPLTSGVVFVAMSEVGKTLPKLVNDVKATLNSMGASLEPNKKGGEVQ